MENLANMEKFILSWSPVAFKNILGMDAQRYDLLMAGVLSELRNPQLRPYLTVYVLQRGACASRLMLTR